MNFIRSNARSLGLAGLVTLVVACSSDNNSSVDTPDTSFDVTLSNLTAGQPMSPVAIVVASNDASVMEVGQAASTSIEYIAEGGDNSFLLNDFSSTALVTTSGVGPIPPGGSETVSITVTGSATADAVLSMVTMLVNTNDALVAAQNIALGTLGVGDTITINTIAYDAGTELDTESAGTMPGPADGGEGFNAVRDDDNSAILAHPGVITSDDGLSTSVLSGIHRWDNPVGRIVITRTN